VNKARTKREQPTYLTLRNSLQKCLEKRQGNGLVADQGTNPAATGAATASQPYPR